MAKTRKYHRIGDVFDDMARDMFTPFVYDYHTTGGSIVDLDKFDLVPKKSYVDELIKRKGEEIEALDRQHESNELYYKERRKELLEDKEALIKTKNKED